MATNRGKATPDTITKLRLFTDSAGFCQNPDCNEKLFEEAAKGFQHIAEMAHICAAIDGGPRTNEELTEEERGAYENLILLCANCHTLVDKNPDEFPIEVMQAWKAGHNEKRERAFGVHKLESREELRNRIEPLLAENAMIHKEVGPDNDYRFNPVASEASVWKQRMLGAIIPNSLKILAWLDTNNALLEGSETETKEKFRYHVHGLIMKHMEGKNLANSRFPPEMESMGRSHA